MTVSFQEGATCSRWQSHCPGTQFSGWAPGGEFQRQIRLVGPQEARDPVTLIWGGGGLAHDRHLWRSALWSSKEWLCLPSRACALSCFGRVRLFATPWNVAHRAPLSIEFSKQEYWSGLPFPSPGDLPDPGLKPTSPAIPALQADSLPMSHQGSPAPGKSLFSPRYSY